MQIYPAAEWVWSEPRKDTSEALMGAKKERERSRGLMDTPTLCPFTAHKAEPLV